MRLWTPIFIIHASKWLFIILFFNPFSWFNHKTNAEDVHFTSVSDDDTSENIEEQVVDDDDDDRDGDPQNESNVASPKSDFNGDDDGVSPTTEILEMIMVRDVKAGAEVSIFLILVT